MGRPRRLEGIETRVGVDGIQRYRGTHYSRGEKDRGPWVESPDTAIEWREGKHSDAREGLLTRERMMLGNAAEKWIAGIEKGTVRNRSGKKYKPSVLRDYRRDIGICVDVAGARKRLDEIRLQDAQIMSDLLADRGLSDSRIRHVMFCLRALYNWAVPRGYAATNPCHGLSLPAAEENPRERIASVSEATLLTAALQVPDRTAFALACYAGLRAGELLALRWKDIDLDVRSIRIDRAIDTSEGIVIAPKSRAAHRNVPIQARLGAVLMDHRSETDPHDQLFPAQRTRRGPQTEGEHFQSLSALHRRVKDKWRGAGLEPLGFHEARHTFASMLIDAGLGAKAIQTYMGHSSITITFDRYGHLLPGAEAEALRLLDAYQDAPLEG